MSGCLALPFRLAALLLLVLLGFLAWSYRDDIRRQIHEWTADGSPPGRAVAERGRAAPAARKLEALFRSGRDSVVLDAAEVASLLDSVVTVVAPRAVDSIEVTLGEDDLGMRARVDTRAVPVPLGPLGGVMRDHEFVEAGGRLIFRQPGRAEWQIERVRVRGIPLPRDLFERLIGRFSRTPAGDAIVLPIPRSVSGLRVRPSGVTLYGTSAGR